MKKKSQYSSQRIRNMFSENDKKPFKLSRSKIEDYICCKRCFFLDRNCGTKQPPMFPYLLNNAVDSLLKNEFDQYREKGKAHPYLIEHGIDAIPFTHQDLDNWRNNFIGIQYYHEATNFMITGAVDDVWINSKDELIIVDYKATSTQKDVSLDDRAYYKRQIEIYQWLFRKNGFNISDTAYFVYCNGDAADAQFGNMLKFKVSLLPYQGDDTWIDNVLLDIKKCLIGNTIPDASIDCKYCKYWFAVDAHIKKYDRQNKLFICMKRRLKFNK